MVIENLEPSPVPSPLASLSLSKSSSPKNKDTPKKTWKRGPKKANKKGNHVVELEPTMTLSVPEPQELAPSTELESMLDSDLEKEVEPPLVEPVNVPEPGLESELEKGNGPEPETFSTVHNPATMIDPLEKDIDPEDSVYCFCRRPAFFGDMVGCDSMQSVC
ncbi:hypothetical protein HMI56_000483 [Coelomomyces lativittatus]|nr:hypothetical protein HMI56_000483 [Coelomomyces lativittatus]